MDITLAKKEFKKYLLPYDKKHFKIKQKIVHTYYVSKMSKYLATSLNLNMEQIELAELIGLLHDIGRFEQLKKYNSCEDYNTIDHAEYGVKVLFEEGLIRRFVKERKFDEIIFKAIQNHNKIKIDCKGMNNEELLHSKLIRDSDKIDNFRIQSEIQPDKFLNVNMQELEQEKLTDKVFERLVKNKPVIYTERKTNIDKWLSVVGFCYDMNFIESLEYIKEKEYLSKAIHQINYKNLDTAKKVEIIEKVANNYILYKKNKEENIVR